MKDSITKQSINKKKLKDDREYSHKDNSSNQNKYLMLLRVPQELVEFVDKVSKEFNFKKSRLAPHITLVPPFKTSWSDQKLKTQLKNIETMSFKQNVSGIDFFEKRNKVIYVDVEVNDYLMKLYLSVRNLLEPVSHFAFGKKKLFRDSYVPHITIAKRLSQQVFLKAKSKLLTRDVAMSWKVDSFWLYKLLDQRGWVPEKEFALDK